MVRAGVRDVAKSQRLFEGLPNVTAVPLDKDPKVFKKKLNFININKK